jgi:DNA modification methylase
MKLMDYKLLIGDCLESMKTLDAQSVNCCVTSPPYYGLRDYGHEGQIGLEDSPQAYVDRLVEVFREVKRVLRDDGTLWLNLGDSYAQKKGHGHWECRSDKGDENGQKVVQRWKNVDASDFGVKPKDLLGIPWMMAFALRADGWYLRQDIIWSKPNPMPESVKDRPTKAHEYIFLLSKSEKYYYDSESVMEDAVSTEVKKFTDGGVDKQKGHSRRHAGFNGRYADRLATEGVPTKRNRRSVWSVGTCPYKGAHFAVFPPSLIEPCVLAGCPKDGVVLDPFGGSGTTAQVAMKNGRNAILCELNHEYEPLIHERILKAFPVREIQGIEQFELTLP